MKEIVATGEAPAAVGPYSQGVRCGDILFISGQLPINVQTGTLSSGDIKAQTRQCIKNIEAICRQVGASLADVVKTTVFVKDLDLFTQINEAYAEFFAGAAPARSCVQVAGLPRDADLEIEAIAWIRK